MNEEIEMLEMLIARTKNGSAKKIYENCRRMIKNKLGCIKGETV